MQERFEEPQRGLTACELPHSHDWKSGQQSSPCPGRYTPFIKTQSCICREFSLVSGRLRAYLGTDESKMGLLEVARETVWPNPPLFRTQRLKERLYLALLAGLVEAGHSELGHPVTPGCASLSVPRILPPIRDTGLFINWTWQS